MDDDLRSRFKSPRRSYDSPSYGRRPSPRPARPTGVKKPVVESIKESFVDDYDVFKNNSTRMVPKKRRAKSKRKKIKLLFPLIFIVLLLAGGFYWFKVYKNKSNNSSQEPKSSIVAEPEITSKGTIKMFATGENFAFDSINNNAKTSAGYNYLPMMEQFKPIFEKADIRLCNETTIGGGEELGVSGYPIFNSPNAWNVGFSELGCNLMNLGSDHTNDKGQSGIDNMVSYWETQNDVLAHAGANKSVKDQVDVKYFTVKDIKFAYLSYTTKTAKTDNTIYGINLYKSELAKQQIEEAKKNAKLVLVSITWGNEDQESISGEQEAVAGELAEYGADVVFGVGPHVLQPAKILDGPGGHQTLVWYSLGNFLNSQLPVNNLIGGMAVLEFDIATSKLLNPKLLPVYMHYEWTPQQKATRNVNARVNFALYPLDLAVDALARSQHGTTVEAQFERVTGVMTQFAPIKIIKSTDL